MKETNMEHFRGEIEEAKFRFGIVDGKIVACNAAICGKCDFFHNESCLQSVTKWLMSPYKPEPVLTQREKHFVELAETGWLARDENNNLFWHSTRPRRLETSWINRESVYIKASTFGKDLFPFITWEDEEPWAVEDLRKLKVKAGDQDA